MGLTPLTHSRPFYISLCASKLVRLSNSYNDIAFTLMSTQIPLSNGGYGEAYYVNPKEHHLWTAHRHNDQKDDNSTSDIVILEKVRKPLRID